MENKYVIEAHGIRKKYKGFALDIPELRIPEGFATALIGENGAGKTTLLNILSGILLRCQGEIRYFDRYTGQDREEIPDVKELIGYTASGSYYVAQWRLKEVEEISQVLFQGFHRDRFEQWCRDLAIGAGGWDPKQKVGALSDGNRMKPLMRDRLCEVIREYLEEGNGQRSDFFSTHNVADMENVTDYAIIMEQGQVVEQGFVEDLKEKYVLVKGDTADVGKVRDRLFTCSSGQYGFEGICLAEKLDRLAGCDVSVERPSLTQISVAVMKHYSKAAKG